jgi:uncharacterized protein (UPF0548 family)
MMTRTLSYAEVGATATGGVPRGFRPLRHRQLLCPAGAGDPAAVLHAAGEAIATWRLHRASGVEVRSSARRAAPGVVVTCGLGAGAVRIQAPCEVIWTVDDERRAGFAYGTLQGHPECGEEAFIAEIDQDGNVWFSITAFSRPGCWYTRLAGPVVPVLQRLYSRRLGRTLARLCAPPG